MTKQAGLGPVFASEWLAVSRRWQWYAARSVFVAGLLGALALDLVGPRGRQARAFRPGPSGSWPAFLRRTDGDATGDGACWRRRRRRPARFAWIGARHAGPHARDRPHFGRDRAWQTRGPDGAGAGHAPVHPADPGLGDVARRHRPADGGRGDARDAGCGRPGLRGRVGLSTWGTKTHEVLLATYAVWALWLLALPMWWGYRLVMGGGAPPTWLQSANPGWLIAAPYLWPRSVGLGDQLAFCGASVVVSAAAAAPRRVAASSRRDAPRQAAARPTCARAGSRDCSSDSRRSCQARRSTATPFFGASGTAAGRRAGPARSGRSTE